MRVEEKKHGANEKSKQKNFNTLNSWKVGEIWEMTFEKI